MSDAPTYEKPQFEPEKILDFAECTAYRGNGIAIENDDSVDLVWTIVIGAVEECKTYLRDKRPFSSDFDCSFRRFVGPWRVSAIKTQDVPGQGANRVMFIVTYSKGYYKTIDWTKARLDSKKQSDEGADLYLLVRFPYCDPASVPAMLASLNTGEVYSNPVIGGITHTGTFYNIFAATKQETDGSMTITLFLAADQYQIDAYRDANTVQEQDVYYYWRVPKATAQGIVTAWRTQTGASATASYNEADTLVDLTLSRRAGAGITLSTSAMPISCDTFLTYYYVFGYTSTEIDTWLAGYESEAGLTAGITRQIRVSERGDGLFDGIVIQTTISMTAEWIGTGATASGYRRFSFDEFSGVGGAVEGGGYKTVRERGWNVTLAIITAIKADNSVGVANQSTKFTVERKDACMFDYELVKEIFVSSKGAVSNTPGGLGTTRSIEVWKNDPAGPVDADLDDSDGADVQLQLEKNDKSTYDWIKQRIKDYAFAEGYEGALGRKWWIGTNQSAMPAYTAGNVVGFNLNVRKTGYYDYVIVEAPTTPSSTSLSDGARGTWYVGERQETVKEVDSGSIVTGATVGFDEIGKIAYTQKEEEANTNYGSPTDGWTTIIMGALGRKWFVGHNVATLPGEYNIDTNPTGIVYANVVGSQINFLDTGFVNYVIATGPTTESTSTVTGTGEKWYFGENASSLPDYTTSLVTDASVGFNDMGKKTYAIREQITSAYASITNTQKSDRYTGITYSFVDIAPDIIQAILTAISGNVEVRSDISTGKPGKISGTITVLTYTLPANYTKDSEQTDLKRTVFLRRSGTSIWFRHEKRTVTQTTTRTHSLTPPSATAVQDHRKNVVQLGTYLWALDDTTVTLGEWVADTTTFANGEEKITTTT